MELLTEIDKFVKDLINKQSFTGRLKVLKVRPLNINECYLDLGDNYGNHLCTTLAVGTLQDLSNLIGTEVPISITTTEK